MTDKYEEFKEWFEKSNYGFWKMTVTDDVVYPTFSMENLNNKKDVFDEFEKEQAEKEKEEQIKQLIEQALKEEKCCYDGRKNYANAIYKKLKEKDLIK